MVMSGTFLRTRQGGFIAGMDGDLNSVEGLIKIKVGIPVDNVTDAVPLVG
jgi:hypothetical protein